jgi:hypothetical protein
MKFRLLLDPSEPEITIVTEDGGIACIRQAEDMGPSPEEKRIAVSDYYSVRIPALTDCNSQNLFECLAEEATIYHDDWKDKPYNDLSVIQTALDWLNPNEENWELVNNLFVDFFPLVNPEQL